MIPGRPAVLVGFLRHRHLSAAPDDSTEALMKGVGTTGMPKHIASDDYQVLIITDPAALAELRTLLVRRLLREGWERVKALPVAERVLVPTGEGTTTA